ncbi:MAG: formate dehydrogenase accessory sulfurtransferase FdhD [Sphingomonadaceae bacterium]|nr:formate dehydrogenase accessory sulfurtransferase FdhD [Sphingomonadaceae bacterium]
MSKTSDSDLLALAFVRVDAAGTHVAIEQWVAREEPIAFKFDGVGHSVLMASPCDATELAQRFAMSERLIDRPADVLDVDYHSALGGAVIQVTVAAEVRARIADRTGHRTFESSCGLCGIENLQQALRPLLPISSSFYADETAMFSALVRLRANRPLNTRTGAIMPLLCVRHPENSCSSGKTSAAAMH